MKEYNIKYKNRNYDLNCHKTSNNLNIIQNDEIERLTEFNRNLLNDIDKLISKKTALESELDIIRSDNKNYRKIIITLIKALKETSFCDGFVKKDIANIKGKLNYRNHNYQEFYNLLKDIIKD
jgi:FtsZ-binding cell division protein ZapB|tara:strand:- start:82 stop:450 length:369 start_codon:yes stop_codon:yes gene_type:complete